MLRTKDGVVVRTDSGNLVYDCALRAIVDAERLADAMSSVAGVAEHGLFVNIATMLLIAGPDGVEVIE